MSKALGWNGNSWSYQLASLSMAPPPFKQAGAKPSRAKHCQLAAAGMELPTCEEGWVKEEGLRPLSHICLKSSSFHVEWRGQSNAASLSLLKRNYSPRLVGGDRGTLSSCPASQDRAAITFIRKEGSVLQLNATDSHLTEIQSVILSKCFFTCYMPFRPLPETFKGCCLIILNSYIYFIGVVLPYHNPALVSALP